jgi:hypothetical protein
MHRQMTMLMWGVCCVRNGIVRHPRSLFVTPLPWWGYRHLSDALAECTFGQERPEGHLPNLSWLEAT